MDFQANIIEERAWSDCLLNLSLGQQAAENSWLLRMHSILSVSLSVFIFEYKHVLF